MLTRIVLLLCLAFGGWQAGFAGVVRIADGDCAALANAVTAAKNVASPTTIFLSRNGAYGSPPTFAGCSISMDIGNVVIEGQGARLLASVCVGIPLAPDYNASHNASLTLRNVSLLLPANTQCDDGGSFGTFGAFTAGVMVLNHGSLTLESVDVVAQSNPFVAALSDGFLYSDGDLVLRNVTVAGVHQGIPFLSGAPPQGSLVNSAGSLEIYNSTFANSGSVTGFASGYPGSPVPIITGYGHLKIANTLFAGNTSQGCDLPGTSLGGNVATETSCGFSASAGDRIVADAGLGSLGDHGGLVQTQAISGGSPAKGAGIAQYCEAADARGYTRSPHGCDAGAYEYGGGSGALTASGMNGFYFDPDANGHYVSLQRIHDNGDIAIVWSTFDSKGNQAWVYGVGQLTDRRIHASNVAEHRRRAAGRRSADGIDRAAVGHGRHRPHELRARAVQLSVGSGRVRQRAVSADTARVRFGFRLQRLTACQERRKKRSHVVPLRAGSIFLDAAWREAGSASTSQALQRLRARQARVDNPPPAPCCFALALTRAIRCVFR